MDLSRKPVARQKSDMINDVLSPTHTNRVRRGGPYGCTECNVQQGLLQRFGEKFDAFSCMARAYGVDHRIKRAVQLRQ